MFSFLLFVILCIAVPGLLLQAVPTDPTYRWVALWAFIPIAYGSYKISLSWSTRGAPLLHSIFGIYVYVNLGLAALVQANSNVYFWPGIYSKEDIFLAHTIIITGLMGFEIGALISRSRTRRGARVFGLSVLNLPRVKASLLIGLFGTLLLFIISGWYKALFVYRSLAGITAGEASLTGSSSVQLILLAMMRALPLVLTVALGLYYLKFKQERMPEKLLPVRFSILPWMIALYGAITLILANPISTPRYWLGTVLVSLAILLFRWLGLNDKKFLPVSLLFGYLVLFPVADTFRRGMSTHELGKLGVGSLGPSIATNLQSGDYDSFQQILNTIGYVREVGIEWGYQGLGTIFFYVPRSIWEAKPIQSGPLVAKFSDYDYTNLAFPLWAEGYIDFGYLGCFTLLALFAYSITSIESVSRRWSGGVDSRMILVILFAGYEIFFLRGALMSAVAYFSPCLIFLIYVNRWRSQ